MKSAGSGSILLALLLCLMLSGCHKQEPAPSGKELLKLAEANLRAGKLDDARKQLSILIKQDPGNAQIHLDMGWLYLYANQPDKAYDELEGALAANPKIPGQHYLRGALYAHLQSWVDALESYNLALNTDPNNPTLHHDIAQAFFKTQDYDGAVKEFQTAARLEPNNNGHVFGICKAYRMLNRLPEALDSCKEALTLVQDEEERTAIDEVIRQISLLEEIDPKNHKPE